MPGAAAWPRGAAAARAALAVASALALQGCLKPPKKCSKAGFNCMDTGCCMKPSHSCYARDDSWAECAESCTPSYSTSCKLIGSPATPHEVAPSGGGSAARTSSLGSSSSAGTSAPTPAPTPAPIHWKEGTWTSAYWDCCKPTCAANGMGDTDYTIAACHAESGKRADSSSGESVCDGGSIGMCADMQPFTVNSNLSYGFGMLAASGERGLDGDGNCGQCFELLFTGERHSEDNVEPWGGAHPELQGKRLVIQVVSVSFETMAEHSFDLLIPGAGQGAYESGCTLQYPDFATDDFDCGRRLGGCTHNSSCASLPKDMREGCSWRFEWYRWLAGGGRTNAPYVKFRRVQCPQRITKISGASPNDDYDYPVVEEHASYAL